MMWFHLSMTTNIASRDLPPLEPLRAFAAAARLSSFQAAARELGLTPSAVSHRIGALERWIGMPLFDRAPRLVTLNAAGRALAADVDAAFARIAMSAAALRDRSGEPLKVSALPLFVKAWLIPRLPRFTARAPHVRLQIEASNRVADVAAGEADIAIRNATSKPAGLAVRKLLDVRGVPLCTPALAARMTVPADLAAMTLIDLSARPGGWRRWLTAAGLGELEPRGMMVFDAMPDALEAAAQGQGVALGLEPIIWASEAARGLVVPFGAISVAESSYYLVHRKADAARPDLMAFANWLTGEMAQFRREAATMRPVSQA
jgi:LysR family glycine cleavage system transcriptional activator